MAKSRAKRENLEGRVEELQVELNALRHLHAKYMSPEDVKALIQEEREAAIEEFKAKKKRPAVGRRGPPKKPAK